MNLPKYVLIEENLLKRCSLERLYIHLSSKKKQRELSGNSEGLCKLNFGSDPLAEIGYY